MKKFIYIVILIILSLVFTLNLLSILNKSFLGFRIFKVATGSMEPYLKIGDLVIIKSSSNYKIQDVITFKDENDKYVTHRIIKYDGEKLITKGDANNTEDNPITKNDIVGKVVIRLKLINFIFYLFTKPLSWILLFVVGLFCIMMSSRNK